MTEAALVQLTASLRASNYSYVTIKLGPDSYRVIAQGAYATATQIKNLETQFGVVGRTNRAEFE